MRLPQVFGAIYTAQASHRLLGLKIDLDERSAMDCGGRLTVAFISCCVRFLA